MIENGITLLVNSDPTVKSILSLAPGGIPMGGFGFDELGKNLPLPSWVFRMFGGSREIVLAGAGPYATRWRRLEISSLGNSADNCVLLANAIDNVLSGFSGLLPDASPGGTLVDACLPLNEPIDFFDSAARSWRRVLEYQVWFRPSQPI